jgi:hypothetical protein
MPAMRNLWIKLQKPVVAFAFLAILALAWRAWAWQGVAFAISGLVLWGLLHITRVLRILQRAAQRPVGYVDSAVMLNAKLRVGVPLLHVLALTRAIGQLESAKDAQPEVFCWTDPGGSQVRGEFVQGRLRHWTLTR